MSHIRTCIARQPATLILTCSLILGGCGGGGGGGAESPAAAGGSAASTVPDPAPDATKTVARVFTDIAVPAGFAWSTVSDTPQARVTVRRADASTGAVRVVISNCIDTDPTGSGAAIEPMSTDVILSALARPAGASSTVVEFGQLRLPAATAQVLVEVFALDGSERLAWRKATPAELAAGSLVLPI